MKRKLFGLWLVLVMLLTQMPFAHAASIEEMSTKVTVREQELQEADSNTHAISAEFRDARTEQLYLKTGESTSSEAEGWSWDGEKQILTLNGLNLDVADNQCAAYFDCAVTLILHGNNIIKSSYFENNSGVGATIASGIYSRGGYLTIEGDGTLTVTGGTSGTSVGIHGGSITINSGTITAIGGTANKNYGSTGIDANKLVINGGSVTAIGGEGGDRSNGIYLSGDDLIINGGNLNALGGSVRNLSSQYKNAGIIIDGSHEIKLSNKVSIEKPSNGRVINVNVVPGSAADSHKRTMIGTQSGETAKEIVIRESSGPNSVSPDRSEEHTSELQSR